MHMHTAQLLRSSCSLTELHLDYCDLGGAADVTSLLEALKENTMVTKLTLDEHAVPYALLTVYDNMQYIRDRVNFSH